jgi:hypothetical protein
MNADQIVEPELVVRCGQRDLNFSCATVSPNGLRRELLSTLTLVVRGCQPAKRAQNVQPTA